VYLAFNGISADGMMDQLAHQLTKYSLWLLPIFWLALGGFALSGQRMAGSLLLIAGISGLIWNFLFMYVDSGQNPQQYWSAVTFVSFADAPLGHIASVYLALLSKASVVGAIACMVFRRG
jgi:hypothetical protein